MIIIGDYHHHNHDCKSLKHPQRKILIYPRGGLCIMIDISGNWIAQWDTQYKAWFYYNIKTGEKNIKKKIMTGVKKLYTT